MNDFDINIFNAIMNDVHTAVVQAVGTAGIVYVIVRIAVYRFRG